VKNFVGFWVRIKWCTNLVFGWMKVGFDYGLCLE